MKEKSLFKNFNFMLLWAGQSVSYIGTSLYNLAITWYILKRTGSAMAMGISVLCFTLPTIIIGPIAGVIADKYDKKKIIVLTDFINGVIMLVLAYLIGKDSIPIGVLYGLMALAASVSAIFSPAIGSSIPLIVDKDNLLRANSLTQVTTRVISILGPALAGLLIAVMDMWVLFLLNGISYLISSASEVFITIPKIRSEKVQERFITQFKEGLKGVWRNKPVLYLVVSGGIIINFFLAPLSIFAALISDGLNRGSGGLGMMESLIGIGALLGGIAILLGFFKNKYKMAIIGLTIEGFALIIIGAFIGNFYMILASVSILGLGVAMASAGISTLYQTLIPKEIMGRVSSIAGTLCSISVPLGALFGSAMLGYFPLKAIMLLSGIIVSIAGLSLIVVLKDHLKHNSAVPETASPNIETA